jgi:hypothetical protein
MERSKNSKPHFNKKAQSNKKGSDATKTPMAVLRKRLRDTQRSLNRPSLPANVRTDLERRVKAIEHDMAQQAADSSANALAQKYKYVKFVERKKILRRIAQLESADKKSDDGIKEEEGDSEVEIVDSKKTKESRLEELRLHLAYIDHFPADLKYVSILSTELSDSGLETRQSILSHLSSLLESGQLTPGKIIRSADIFTKKKQASASSTTSVIDTSKPPQREDDFFMASS